MTGLMKDLRHCKSSLTSLIEPAEDLLKPRESPVRELTQAQRNLLLRWPE